MTSRAATSPVPSSDGGDRFHALLAAHRSITDDLSLRSVLDRIVRTACELVGARYGALGVIAGDGSVEHFVHHGLTADMIAHLDRIPRGTGLVGAVASAVGAIRLDDLTGDPRASNFPAARPAMRSFLGVPIRAHGSAFGELYLADPAVGRFGHDDEELVLALAATAGTAIENARLYDDARRSRDWLKASGVIARALLAGADDRVLLDVVSQAFSVADADYACLILPTDDGCLEVAVAKGVGAEQFRGHVFDPAESTLGKAILAAESIRTSDMTLWANVDFDNRFGFGPAMIVPLLDAHGSRGAVLMLRLATRLPFTAHDVELASSFATQVALALELNETRAEAEWVRVLEVRHRIARGLHDNVMQRLFATGVGLQAIAEQPLDREVSDRLRRHVADLDDTIDEIRTRVFGLRDDDAPEPRRRTRLRGATTAR